MFIRRRAIISAMAAIPAPALAQGSYPTRPVRLVVPFAPGGQTDLLARLLAPLLSAELGQPVVVENRAGGSTMIGAEVVARSAKDGHTVFFGGPSAFVIAPQVYSRMSYRPEELQPVSLICTFPFIFSVRSSFPGTDIADIVTYARAQPEGITYASVGRGSSTHISGEILAQTLGIRMIDVIYRGIGPAQADLVSGKIDASMDSFSQAIPYHSTGQYRIVGSMGRERWPSMPEIPTFLEAGYPQAVYESWFGLFVPAGSPDEAVRRLGAATAAVLAGPDIRARMLRDGQLARSSTPQELAALIREDYEVTGAVIRRLNLRLD